MLLIGFVYAQMPTVWPGIDQTVMIDDSLLQAPIVQNAWQRVQQVVAPELLSITPAVYNPQTPSNPLYQANAMDNCYWPATKCTTPKHPNVRPDILTCPQQNQSHHPLTSLTNQQIVAEIMYNDAIIFKTIGDIDDRVRAIVQALGYEVVLWNKDSRDSHGISAEQVMSEIRAWTSEPSQPGFISLEHDISTFSADIAISAIGLLSGSSLQPMSVGMCLQRASYQDQPEPTRTTLVPSATRTATRSSTRTRGPRTTLRPTQTRVPSVQGLQEEEFKIKYGISRPIAKMPGNVYQEYLNSYSKDSDYRREDRYEEEYQRDDRYDQEYQRQDRYDQDYDIYEEDFERYDSYDREYERYDREY
ncbi:hypothetical protein EDD86DRAFT_250321 [Gorgonomyces haynaldii]|nr:hypothetical protein EDD86DRAFT_250321 [Gorgonomyces haynaldii]